MGGWPYGWMDGDSIMSVCWQIVGNGLLKTMNLLNKLYAGKQSTRIITVLYV